MVFYICPYFVSLSLLSVSVFSNIFIYPLFFFKKKEPICVITCDGRIIIGTLIGYDQVQNLIVNEAKERIYSNDTDVEEMILGLYLVRGDNVCMIGDYDPIKMMDETIRIIQPLPEIHQQQF